MTGIIDYVASKAGESGFYPTPPRLVDKMLAGIDWRMVDSILEPSAGKGDLALPAEKRWQRSRGYYTDSEQEKHRADLDCVEIDPNLRAILKDKGLRVVHDDFLTYTTMKRYSLIIMNPPFEDAARHILKAISLLKPEGKLIALCNAETLRNPYTNDRYMLIKMLENAKIDYLPGEFLTAERKTAVETALIAFTAPADNLTDGLIIDNLKPAHKYVDMTEEESAALTKSDFVEAIIDRYNYEVESGVKLIREWKTIRKSMTCDLEMKLNNNDASENEWVKAVRYRYWSTLFAAPQFVGQLTSNLRDKLFERLKELQDYEFSYFNIKEIMIQMTAQVSTGIESTIMKLFDDWTRKYHWDENASNRHYFDGWRTNNAFAVNKKVILPLRGYTDWGSYCEAEFRMHNVIHRLQDIEKVFNYLDGGRTPEKDLGAILSEAEKTGQTKKLDSKYFYLTFYKKGTCHVEFKDLKLLAKFNLFAARGKNWLPPSFGRKHYKDMTPEEQRVVSSFTEDTTGKKYEEIMSRADYYLQTGSEMLNLPA